MKVVVTGELGHLTL